MSELRKRGRSATTITTNTSTTTNDDDQNINVKKSKNNNNNNKIIKFNYKVGDKVMALDKINGAIYEAKILKLQNFNKQIKYFIHYQKWNPKYDTWTDDINLAPYDNKDAIARLQGSARVIIVADDKKGKKNKSKNIDIVDEKIATSSSSSSSSSTTTTTTSETLIKNPIINRGIVINETALKKARKQLAESDQIDFDDTPDNINTLTIDIPINLKEHLVDEHGLICNEPKHLVSLPRNYNVATIIQDFLEFKKSKLLDNPDNYLIYKELFDGLCLFFDKSLPTILLYRHERQQYQIISETLEQDNKQMIPSLIYGSEHLLRLFSRLSMILSHLFLPVTEMNQITNKMSEFLKWFSNGKKSEINDKKILPKYIEIEEYVLADKAMKLKEKLSSSGRKVRQSKKQISDDYIA